MWLTKAEPTGGRPQPSGSGHRSPNLVSVKVHSACATCECLVIPCGSAAGCRLLDTVAGRVLSLRRTSSAALLPHCICPERKLHLGWRHRGNARLQVASGVGALPCDVRPKVVSVIRRPSRFPSLQCGWPRLRLRKWPGGVVHWQGSLPIQV